MAEKSKYNTRQKTIILQCLEQNKEMFCTVDQFMEFFCTEGVNIGRTTVYRALERLHKEGIVLKVPSVEGAPAQYRFIEEDKRENYGKLVCLKCGRVIPLQCGCIDNFFSHILEAHKFELDQGHTILYGYCEECRANSL